MSGFISANTNTCSKINFTYSPHVSKQHTPSLPKMDRWRKRTILTSFFSIAEFSEMLKQTGLTLKQVFSTPRKRPFNLGDEYAYLLAVKEEV